MGGSLAFLAFLNGAYAEKRPEPAVLSIQGVPDPSDAEGQHLSVFASFSRLPAPAGWLRVVRPEDAFGCEPWTVSVAPLEPWVAVVDRGNCTFIAKARQAQDAGASGVVVVSDFEGVIQLVGYNESATEAQQAEENAVTIFAASIPQSLGLGILLHADSAQLAFKAYSVSFFDVAEFLLICLATSLVVAGAVFSTSDLRAGSGIVAPTEEEVMEVDQTLAFGFCISGSVMLVVLFYFMRWMIYFIIFCFCCGGATCAVTIIGMWLQYMFPKLRRQVDVPLFGYASQAEVIACLPSGVLVLCFLTFRNTSWGWLFQDTIGAGFLCMMQRSLRLPNIQVATVLLTAMFFFDIFWVFISPWLFFTQGKSVMVEVARGGGTGESVPMLLKIPAIGDPFGNDRMLGFGDVALPGLLVSYLLRHDMSTQRFCFHGYFVPAVVGYFLGLCVTIMALYIMRMGQPALLYLVPSTLGTTLGLGWSRGELRNLWKGEATKTHIWDDEETMEMIGNTDAL